MWLAMEITIIYHHALCFSMLRTLGTKLPMHTYLWRFSYIYMMY